MSTATTIDAASLRNRKAQVFSAIALAKNLDASDYATAIPITAGSGAPSHNALVTNEIYIRTDASDSDTLIYRAVDTSGTWEAIIGSEVTELLAAANAWSNTNDFSKTITSADELINADLSVNHATAVGKAIEAALIQATTARSSGTVAAFAASCTSLAGDSGGVYVDFLAQAPTDGGGTVTHTAISIAAGHDVAVDFSAAATGESDLVIGDNLASALEIREAANVYMRVVTTNSSESVAFGQRVTTTDGVSGGTARVMGGRASSNTAAGSALTNSTSETVLGSYSIPANTLKAGSVLTFKAKVKVTANNGATTLTGRCRLGATTLTGTILYASAAVDTGANDIFWITGELISWAAPSAAAAVEGMGSVHDPGAAGTALKSWSLDATNFATDGALLLEITGQWSAADANSCQLEHLSVSIA